MTKNHTKTLIFTTLDTSQLKKLMMITKNIHNLNPLYLIIHFATEHFKEKNDDKYSILDSTDKYEEVWPGIRSEIKTTNEGKELFFWKKLL